MNSKQIYKQAVNRCCNPRCGTVLRLEVHHIHPLSKGGEDRFINYITLCHKCHNAGWKHRDWRQVTETLLRWKFMVEQMVTGTTSDTLTQTECKALLMATTRARKMLSK